MGGFRRLDGRSDRPVRPVIVDDESAVSLRIEAREDGSLKRLEVHTGSFKCDFAIEKQRVVDGQASSPVADLATAKDSAGVIGPVVKLDVLVLNKAASSFHFSSPSLGRTTTIAEAAGEAMPSRIPGGGGTA